MYTLAGFTSSIAIWKYVLHFSLFENIVEVEVCISMYFSESNIHHTER